MVKRSKSTKKKSTQKTVHLRSLRQDRNLHSEEAKHDGNASTTSNCQELKVLKTTTLKAANLFTKADTSWDKTERSGYIEENNVSKWSNTDTTDSKYSGWSTSRSTLSNSSKCNSFKLGIKGEEQCKVLRRPKNLTQSYLSIYIRQDNNESKRRLKNSTRSDMANSSKRNYQNSLKFDSKHTRFDHCDSKRNNYRTDSPNKYQNNSRHNKMAVLYKSQSISSYDGSFIRDEEYDEFKKLFKENKLDVKQITEKFGDLFEVSKEYALAHCVAEDMKMGAGIALQFRREFKNVDKLLNQRQKEGGCAYLNVKGRYIYYLVTKRKSYGKPTSLTLWKSLCKMRCLIKEHGVKHLAMPTIGCGLDGLKWSKVKLMVEYVFRDYDIEILVCKFRQAFIY